MRQTRLVPLVVLAAVALEAPTGGLAAQAAGPVAPEVVRVLRDCRDHRETLTVRLDRAELGAVYREFRRGGALRTRCGLAVSSRFSGKRLRPRNASTQTIVDDCVRGAGALSKRYTAQALKRAYRALNRQLRTETGCPVGITSQYNANRPKKSRALLPPRAPRLPPRAPAGTAESTGRALGRYLAVFARPRTSMDAVPAWAVGPLANEVEPADVPHARVLGTRGDLVVVPSAEGYAVALRAGPGAVATTYTPRLTTASQLQTSVTRVVGGLKIWAPALVGMHRVRLLDAEGRWSSVSLNGDAIEITLPRVPMILTYLDRDDVLHYSDFNYATGGQVPAPRS